MSYHNKIFFPHKELNGILRHFYKKDKKFYDNQNLFSYSSSGCNKGNFDYLAFDFDSGMYWMHNSQNENFLSFCFKKGFVDLKGYEILTSPWSYRPYIWTLSGSNDNVTWFGNQTENYFMNISETHFAAWNNGPSRCFRFDFLKNTNNNSRASDVKQIELFGRYIPDDLKLYSCRTRYHNNKRLILFVFLVCLK